MLGIGRKLGTGVWGRIMAVTLGRKHHKDLLEPDTKCHSGQCKPPSQYLKPPLHHVYINQIRSNNMLI